MTKDTTNNAPPIDKAGRMVRHEEAAAKAVDTGRTLLELRAATAAAEIAHAEALGEAEKLYGEAYADDMLAQMVEAETNEKRHKEAHGAHCHGIGRRRAERLAKGESEPDHRSIKVFTVDGATHEVVSAHGLLVGCHGFAGDRCADGSRYKAGCGISVDARHDELDHERFDQTRAPNCAACGSAIAMMGTGELPDARSEYLTAAEAVAHTRARHKRENRDSSERERTRRRDPR